MSSMSEWTEEEWALYNQKTAESKQKLINIIANEKAAADKRRDTEIALLNNCVRRVE